MRADWRLGALLLATIAPGAALADPSRFAGARRVAIEGYAGDVMEPFITRDGRYLLFNNSNAAPDRTDLYYAERVDAVSFRFRGPIAGANSPALDAVASLDDAGELFFVSTRSYAQTLSSLYRAHFDRGVASEVEVVPGVSANTPGFIDFDAEVSADGRTLYVAEGDFRGDGPKPRAARIVLFERLGQGFHRSADSERLLAAVNAGGLAYAPSISADGRELYFTHVPAIGPGAVPRIYRAWRATPDAPFGTPQRVTAASGFAEAPSLSADGHRLYFHRREGARFILWEAQR